MQRTVVEGGASGVWRERRRRGCVHKLAGRDKMCSRKTPELVEESVPSQSAVSVCLSVCVSVTGTHRDSRQYSDVWMSDAQ